MNGMHKASFEFQATPMQSIWPARVSMSTDRYAGPDDSFRRSIDSIPSTVEILGVVMDFQPGSGYGRPSRYSAALLRSWTTMARLDHSRGTAAGWMVGMTLV